MMDETDRGVEIQLLAEDSISPSSVGGYEFPADLGPTYGRPRAERPFPSARARRLQAYLNRLDH